MGWRLDKEPPSPCTNRAGAIAVELVTWCAQLVGQWPQGLSCVLEVRVLSRRLYEAHLLGGVGSPDRKHSWSQWTPLEASGGLGTLPWSWEPLSTEWKGGGAFCTMEKPEGRG